MIKPFQNYANVEKLINLVADSQSLAKSDDKLTALLEKYSSYMSEELNEDELDIVTAAKMPAIPKYKQI